MGLSLTTSEVIIQNSLVPVYNLATSLHKVFFFFLIMQTGHKSENSRCVCVCVCWLIIVFYAELYRV